MKKQGWRRAPALLCAAAVLLMALPCAAEGALPEPPETKKEYNLLLSVEGPADVRITRPGDDPDAPGEYFPPGAPCLLKEGEDYRVELKGTGEGTLTWVVTRQDPSGKEEDRELHRFEDIPLTDKTVITADLGAKRQCTLLADTDGDGRVDAAYGSGENSPNFTVTSLTVILAGILILFVIALPLLFRREKTLTILQKPILQRKG